MAALLSNKKRVNNDGFAECDAVASDVGAHVPE